MPSRNWGPIPAFAARLAATVPRRPNGKRRPLAATRPFGGPWGLLVRKDWPRTFPRLRGPGSRWLLALGEQFRRSPQPARRFRTDAELARNLMEVQRFLVIRNLKFLTEHLPGPAAFPPEVLSISSTGLAWALWVYEQVAHGTPTVRWTKVRVGPQDWPETPTLGDALSLHLWIEELLAGDDLPGAPTETARILGGLRTPTFLRRLPWLYATKLPQYRQRRRIVRELLPFSTLSQWIYPDLIRQSHDQKAVTLLTRLGSHESATPEMEMACEGWQSLLARSLLAALLGPTAAWEARTKAEDELRSARQTELGMAGLSERKRLLERTEELKQETFMLGVLRPVRLGDLLTQSGACGTLLAMRTLDMLVRHLVQVCGPLLLRDLSTNPHNPTLSELVLQPGNRLFRRLTESLFGGANIQSFADLSPGHASGVERLVLPSIPTDSALSSMAKLAGISVAQAQRIRDHFAKVPLTLPHPLRDGTPPTPTPAALLTAWCASMRGADQPPEEENDDDAEVEEETVLDSD